MTQNNRINTQGFAFFAWVRANVQQRGWFGPHGWDCSLCRKGWRKHNP